MFMSKWNKSKVIKKLKLFARKLGHPPSKSELSQPLYGACNYHFGNVNKNLKRIMNSYEPKYLNKVK